MLRQPAYWTTALAGEVGERRNMIRKMQRVEEAVLTEEAVTQQRTLPEKY